MNQIEVCFSPTLYSKYDTKDKIVIVVDIFRATTAICAAFENGAKDIIPVQTIEEAKKLKLEGYIVAAERDGKVLDFADFGNSPFNFTPDRVNNKTIAYSTTNGTKTIKTITDSKEILIGAFVNISVLFDYIIHQNTDIFVFCAGWKGRFNLEDTLFAGLLAEKLLATQKYTTICDSTLAAIDLWQVAQNNLPLYIEKAAHRNRLRHFNLDDVVAYCLTENKTKVLPFYNSKNNKLELKY